MSLGKFALGASVWFAFVGCAVEGEEEPELVDAEIVNGTRDYSVNAVGALYGGCTGTMISPTRVLTARHCCNGAGGLAFNNNDSAWQGTWYPASGYEVHPSLDLCVVSYGALPPAAAFQLASANPSYGQMLTLTGYGANYQGGGIGYKYSGTAQVLTWPGAEYVIGAAPLGYGSNGSAENCNGDSGGPSLDGTTVHGVVSRGYIQGTCNNDAWHVSASYSRDWILSQCPDCGGGGGPPPPPPPGGVALYQELAPAIPSYNTNIYWNYNMGYAFTPSRNIRVTALGGFFNGSKTVRLYRRSDGAELASAQVSAANNWSYASIGGVELSAGVDYSVAVYLAGSGGAYVGDASPQSNADVTIWGTCYRYASVAEPCSPGSNQSYVYGIPDIAYE